MTPFLRLPLVSWLMASALVTGCASPAQKLDRSARTARSWTATARTTSKALAEGAVPRVYATQVLRAALETKRQLAQQPEWQSLPQNTRSRLDDAIRELASSLDPPADSLQRP